MALAGPLHQDMSLRHMVPVAPARSPAAAAWKLQQRGPGGHSTRLSGSSPEARRDIAGSTSGSAWFAAGCTGLTLSVKILGVSMVTSVIARQYSYAKRMRYWTKASKANNPGPHKHKRRKYERVLKGVFEKSPLRPAEEKTIFRWITFEGLLTAKPAKIALLDKVAQFSKIGSRLDEYDPPQYRTPPARGVSLAKGLLDPAPLDEDPDAQDLSKSRLHDTLVEACADYGTMGAEVLQSVDIVTSLEALELLIAFIDRRMPLHFEAKGRNARRPQPEAAAWEIMRIGHVPKAPETITLGTLARWDPVNDGYGSSLQNSLTFLHSFKKVCAGSLVDGGTMRSLRDEGNDRIDYQVLLFNIGNLRVLVQVPVEATVPAEDLADLDGEAVQMHTATVKRASAWWDRYLSSRYVSMVLGNVGLAARGILRQGAVVEVQEFTQQDLLLDRSYLEEEADELVGRLEAALMEIKDVANSPGGRLQDLSIHYSDNELLVACDRLVVAQPEEIPEDLRQGEVLERV